MIGVIFNCAGVALGTVFGLIFKKALVGRRHTVVMQALAICILVIGVMDAFKVQNLLLLIVSLVLGGFLGALLHIEEGIERFGEKISAKFSKGENQFSIGHAFVTSSLIFCIGAMAIYGSIQAGLGDNTTLYTKTLLDSVTSAVLAATLGIGVIFSIVPLFILQGSIALLATVIQPIATPVFLNQLSATGGILVIAIGINLLGIKKIHTADMLPAVLFAFLILLL